jgi:branched-chain amino acid transport system permease protein
VLALDYAFAGLVIGAVAALAGVGLLVTYRATGVFNIAHGALGALAAYTFWQLITVWHVNTALAAVCVLLIGSPLLGIAIERLVFRPLQRREASAAESLVATIGILGLLIGVIYEVPGWGAQPREAPALFPSSPIHLGSVIIQSPALIDIGIVLVVTVAIAGITRWTRLGTEIRAVVNRRDLAELAAVDTGRVSAIAWAVGVTLASLTGILLAPQTQLDPFQLTLLLLEIFAVPVIAGLTSIPIAILAGLLIGIGQSEMNLYSPAGATAQTAWNALQSNLPVVVLLAALLIRRQLTTSGGDAGSAATLARRRAGEPSTARQAVQYAVAAVAIFSPLAFNVTQLREAQQIPALAIIFVSIVAVTGFSGQISLGQAGYAGLGALMFAHFSSDAPELVALLLAMLGAGLVGFVTGYPAIRRRGLFLALTTFAVGAFVSRFVFQQPYFTTDINVARPSIFGLSIDGDRAFYLFELVALAFAFYVMSTLQRGRLGRALIAIRDSETGARSIGVDVRHLKIFIFTVSAGLAGLGGALLAEQSRSFAPDTWDPLQGSLFWFAVVVVFGSDSPAGAVVGAAFVVAFDALAGNDTAFIIPVGLLAAFLGYLPGGAAELGRRIVEWLITPTHLMRRYQASLPAARVAPVLSARGEAVVAALHARRDVPADRP